MKTVIMVKRNNVLYDVVEENDDEVHVNAGEFEFYPDHKMKTLFVWWYKTDCEELIYASSDDGE